MTLHQLSVLSVCYNPFIYCWINEAFRVRAKKGRAGESGGGGGYDSRNLCSRLLCGSGGGSCGRRCSPTGTSTIGGGDESYSFSGVGGGAGGGGGLVAGNNTTATTLTTRVSSFTILNINESVLQPSVSAATIIDTVVDTANQVAGPASSPRAQWTVQL
ncbi:Serpentine type 7TM GPCR chemoreceptor Srsx [Tyrophagus putrescentiae]|nr:Serpentine type 7TM GPCR chemoreceptor Srsx [Tyrophagus putrescentiae]